MGANAVAATSVYLDRIERVRSLMAERGVDVLLLSVGHDLPYLTGYEAMPLERLTMLVLPQRRRRHAGRPPARGAARRRAARACSRCARGTRPRTRSPSSPSLAGRPGTAAVGDQTWARFLVDLLAAPAGDRVPARRRGRSARCGCARTPPRSPRSRAAGAAADRVAAQLQAGDDPARRPHRGRRCRPTSPQRLIAEGHDKVNFAIVAAGEQRRQPAPPRRRPRLIERGRGRAVRLRRHDGRLLLRHHPLRVTWASRRPRSPRPTPCCTRRRQAGVAAGDGRHAVRGRRPGRPRHHRRRRLRRLLHPPHRPRHRHGGARGPVHRRGQRRAARARATPSASSPASTCPAGGACASRTSWSPPTTDRSR